MANNGETVQFPSHPIANSASLLGEDEAELKIQFVDAVWLMQSCLDSEATALQYFYMSPFYHAQRHGTINEYQRAGKEFPKEIEEYSHFRISYSNLSEISSNPACKETDFRPQEYFNTRAIFHVSLNRVKIRENSESCQTIKIYGIIMGCIYRLPTWHHAVRYRLGPAADQLGEILDSINTCMRFDINNGYYWKTETTLDEERKLETLQKNYGINSTNLEAIQNDPQNKNRISVVYHHPVMTYASDLCVQEMQRLGICAARTQEIIQAINLYWSSCLNSEEK